MSESEESSDIDRLDEVLQEKTAAYYKLAEALKQQISRDEPIQSEERDSPG